ncbi:MAG: hypothetical protein P4L33_14585 [Capsulimonadaceae bacterium]|nr:hypothetical protein [Capsulimonadaceae bacterium]
MPIIQAQETEYSLTEILEYFTVDELKKMLALFNQPVKPTRKADVIAVIVLQYDGDGLTRLWSRLDDLQQAAVAETIYSDDGVYDAGRFVAKYGSRPTGSPAQKIGTMYGSSNSISVLDLFIFKGRVPSDLRARLIKFVPPPRPTALTVLDETPTSVDVAWVSYDYDTGSRKRQVNKMSVPVTILETERLALEDAVSMLRAVEAGKIQVSDKTKLPVSATLKETSMLISGGDFYSEPQTIDDDEYTGSEIGPIKAFAWPMLLQGGGLAEISGKKLRLTAAGQKATRMPPVDVLRSLWKKWLSSTILDELRRIDVIKGQTGRGQRGLTALSKRRAPIVMALGDCPPGKWVSVSDFERYMTAMNYDFEVTRDLWSLYVASAEYGSLGYDGSGQVLESRYLLCFLFEYAATLGLIDVCYIPPELAPRDYRDMWGTDDLEFFSRYDGLMAFRVNSLGAYCLGKSNAYVEAPLERRPALHVLPNHEIVQAGDRLPSGDMLLLGIYAEKVSDSVWKLDQSKMLTALEAGNDIARLREFLQARSAHELPDTVLHFLSDLESRSHLLADVGIARLIECKDKAIAAMIAGDTRTGRLCKLAGERHLVVQDDQMAAFRRALRSAGYVLPTSSGN